jgi:predicted AlkP superfamily phosphohydrolase/phosphomutase
MLRRGFRLFAGVAVVVTALAAATTRCGRAAQGGALPRVIVLGLDGMDLGLTTRFMAEGKLPGLSRLKSMGGFSRLDSAIPPQSPVAWSDFITGMDAGGHGIFDFIHRDPATLLPYLSTSRSEAPRHVLELGGWKLPLSGGRVELLRRGEAFWEVLHRRGIPTTILRMPANFPPSGTADRELSGMGTPDVLGGYGTFSYYTTDRLAFLGQRIEGGEVYRIEATDGVVKAALRGPENPFRSTPQRVEAPFTIYLDPDRPAVKLVVGAEERVLQEGEWSDWVRVSLGLVPTQSVSAQVRFFLRRVRPNLELYVSPLNLDPFAPAMPISTPASYAGDLARATGRYYTQGMPENTGALSAGILSSDEFLAQARIAGDEVIAEFPHVLKQFDRGLLFYYIGNLDLIGHMMWRPMDEGHPAFDPQKDPPLADVVPETYAKLDGLVSYALDHMGSDTLLVAMSDHGFASWRRVFHLNAWLHQNGYLVVKDESLPDDVDMLRNVDWSRTRAYGFGLSSLYVNLKGREKHGIVEPDERLALLSEMTAKLKAVVDSKTGRPAVANTYVLEDTFSNAGQRQIGPDVVMGYTRGTRNSDESALGAVGREVLTDNQKPWSGDHIMDAPDVPGILATSRPLKRPAPSLKRLAAAILAEFGVLEFPRSRPTQARANPN